MAIIKLDMAVGACPTGLGLFMPRTLETFTKVMTDDSIDKLQELGSRHTSQCRLLFTSER